MNDGLNRHSVEYVTLRDYIDSRFMALQHTLAATDKANEYRLERMNEFRGSLEDQTRQYVTKAELGILAVEIKALQRQTNMAIGGLFILQVVIGLLALAWNIFGF
jgi:hypothetical protein